jgi:hypothetical protein
VTLGAPADIGSGRRRPGLDRVLRVQAAPGSAIVGVSHIVTQPYQPARYARGRAQFFGLDGRWMRAGVTLRGEWITGRPFDGTRTTGGYADLMVHRPSFGPATIVFRAERLVYEATPTASVYAQRYTAGARVRVLDRLSVQANVLTQRGLKTGHRAAFDLGLTYVFRRD